MSRDNGEKWIKRLYSYTKTADRYDLPTDIFGLPDKNDANVDKYLKIAEDYWESIDVKTIKPFDNTEITMPYWMVFTLPRRPAIVYFAVWDLILREKDLQYYQDAMLSFQDLIQNYKREELLLFKIVRPFRKILGISVQSSDKVLLDDIPEEMVAVLRKFSTPQKVLESIAQFIPNKTLQLGIAYVLMIEKFSVLLKNVDSRDHLLNLIKNFKNDENKLKQLDYIIPQKSKHKSTNQVEEKVASYNGKSRTTIEFRKIELQEYDGYVQITGFSEDEIRNFRVFDCKEEDDLREEIWKERRYPIRKIVSDLLEERYSTSTKAYKLKWGVDIKLLEPNWLN